MSIIVGVAVGFIAAIASIWTFIFNDFMRRRSIGGIVVSALIGGWVVSFLDDLMGWKTGVATLCWWGGALGVLVVKIFQTWESHLADRHLLARSVQARSFVIVDEQGKERILLNCWRDLGPKVELLDQNGARRVEISVEEGGEVYLKLFSVTGTPRDYSASLRVTRDGKGILHTDSVYSEVFQTDKASVKRFRARRIVPYEEVDMFEKDPFWETEENDD